MLQKCNTVHVFIIWTRFLLHYSYTKYRNRTHNDWLVGSGLAAKQPTEKNDARKCNSPIGSVKVDVIKGEAYCIAQSERC